jgi:hypothetical protein
LNTDEKNKGKPMNALGVRTAGTPALNGNDSRASLEDPKVERVPDTISDPVVDLQKKQHRVNTGYGTS